MPPRWVTGAVIVFWLGTTGWMAYREWSFRQQAGEPPPFAIDLTDEVSANTISWRLRIPQVEGKDSIEGVGLGRSWVRRRADRTFQLHSEFRFTGPKVNGIPFRKITSMYRVTADGELKGLASTAYLDKLDEVLGDRLGFLGLDKSGEVEITVAGEVENGFFVPRLTFKSGAHEVPLDVLPKIKVSGQRRLINPMHLVGKITGLRAGQRWLIPSLNPLQFEMLKTPMLEAEVHTATLRWNEQETDCFRIDYHEPDKKVTASTWVRRPDGLVLQQQAEHEGKVLILEREK